MVSQKPDVSVWSLKVIRSETKIYYSNITYMYTLITTIHISTIKHTSIHHLITPNLQTPTRAPMIVIYLLRCYDY